MNSPRILQPVDEVTRLTGEINSTMELIASLRSKHSRLLEERSSQFFTNHGIADGGVVFRDDDPYHFSAADSTISDCHGGLWVSVYGRKKLSDIRSTLLHFVPASEIWRAMVPKSSWASRNWA